MTKNTSNSIVDELSDIIKQVSLDDAQTTGRKPWNKSHLRTGLIYDDRMALHNCIWTTPDECPKRYEIVRDKIREYQLEKHCLILEPKFATKEDVLLVHSEEYFNKFLSLSQETNVQKLKDFSSAYDAIYINQHSFDAAMLAVGCSLHLTDSVIDGSSVRNGFAILRPPGHHANRNEANGFCLFNNAAIAAKHARLRRCLNKVLIVDWDVHHGQGIQSIFYDDPNVLYFSVHRYEYGIFWPNLRESNFNYTGTGPGKGFNVNVPLPTFDCTDGDYLSIWFHLLLPIAYEFNPDLVIISSGYDAAIGCPEGKMLVKPATFATLCHSLMSLANGKVVCLLEGGYNISSLGESAAMTVNTLVSNPVPREKLIDLDNSKVRDTLLGAIWALRPKWKSLCSQGAFSKQNTKLSSAMKKTLASKPIYSKQLTPKCKYYHLNTDDASDIAVLGHDEYGLICEKDEERQKKLETLIPQLANCNSRIPLVGKRTLLVFNELMADHQCLEGPHPECPDRYLSIIKRLNEHNLLSRCAVNHGRQATKAELSLVHSPDYITRLEQTSQMTQNQRISMSSELDSIYINDKTYQAAIYAVGCVIEAIDRVYTNQNLNAFAIVRPPGHHAGPDYPAGFCFFNNVMIGAHHALRKYPECKKILIVDFDYHHGDGTQTCIEKLHKTHEEASKLLFISLHAYDNAREYPCKTKSNFTKSGNVVNIPWNSRYMRDSEYMLTFFTIILPLAHEFSPDLVIVSAGFDAAINDLIGHYKISPAAYGHFIHHLSTLAEGRLVACLEGGYNLESLSEASAYVVAALLGDSPARLANFDTPTKETCKSLQTVMRNFSDDYQMIAFDYNLPIEECPLEA